ncbi:MAG: hypothetical protein ACFFDR_11095 [Candidatus Thorarchaeota archaeon]
MGSQRILRYAFVFSFLCVFLLLPLAHAQTTLTINQRLNNEFLFGRESQFYEPNLYQITLEEGNWTLVITSYTDLEVKVTIATYSNMTGVIEETSSMYAELLILLFYVPSSGIVYIEVEEASNHGDISGVYNIGVYDEEHLASATIDTFTIPSSIIIPFNIEPILLFSIAIFVIGVAVVCVVCLKTKSSLDKVQNQIIQAPHAAIPQKYQGRVEGDDGLRAVRVPVNCPSCNAPLSSETIDWVGPLEAKCTYCGATVRAKFERI